MAKGMSALLDAVAEGHRARPAKDAAREIAAFEAKSGRKLPADVKAFYRRFSSATLHDETYRILPLRQARRADRDPEVCPESYWAFVDVQDDNYVGIDLASPRGKVLDLFHETIDDAKTIAPSFTVFLERALAGGAALYFLKGAKKAAAAKSPPASSKEFPLHELRAQGASFGVDVTKKGAMASLDIGMRRMKWGKYEVSPELRFSPLPLRSKDIRRIADAIPKSGAMRGYLEYYLDFKRVRVPASVVRVTVAAREVRCALALKRRPVSFSTKLAPKVHVSVWVSAAGLTFDAPKEKKLAACLVVVRKHLDAQRLGAPKVHNYAVSFDAKIF